MTRHAPYIGALSRPLVRVFSLVVIQPDRWFTVPELVQAGAASRATVYRRCGNLAAAGVLRKRRRADQVEFTLHPEWADTALGQALRKRLGGPETGPVGGADTAG